MAASSFAQTTPAGWTPDWSDEFNGTSLDNVRWSALDRKDSYNNEKEYYRPSQVTESGGTLNITASNVPYGGKLYQSGLVQTIAQQTYGRWEIRASLPATQGMWPAIWLLPQNAAWPTGGEIDIMENRGSAPTIVGSAFHYGTSVATHQYVNKDFSYAANGTPVSFQNSMHTYAVEWDPSRIRYIIDGVPSYTFYRNTAPISATPMALILNLAVGGDFGGDPNGTTVFPQKLAVDYVRVFDRDNTTRALDNGSFETKAGSLFTSWDEYSNGGGNVLPDSVASHAHTGTTAAQLYGRFDGTSSNTSGLYQEVPAMPGEVFQVGAFSQNRPGDLLAGANVARIKIEFIDQNGAVLTQGQLGVADATSAAVYREGVVRSTAPANAKFARAVLEMQQINNAGGAVDFDDASLKLVAASSDARDINLDGVVNGADLDALNHSLTADNKAFDFNHDSVVNATDVDSILASAFHTTRGDTNLDQAVNFDDLLTLAQNYGTVGTGSWAQGDFNGDLAVNFDDLLALAQNYGNAPAGLTAGIGPDGFASDWALARSLVPEPASLGVMTAGFLLAGLTRRRHEAAH